MTFLKGKLSEKKKRKTDSKKKDTKTFKTNEKEVVFKDVRLFRIMPLIFMLGVILVGSGAGYAMYANHQYQVAQGKLSMAKNTPLPILTGSSDYGTLTTIPLTATFQLSAGTTVCGSLPMINTILPGSP